MQRGGIAELVAVTLTGAVAEWCKRRDQSCVAANLRTFYCSRQFSLLAVRLRFANSFRLGSTHVLLPDRLRTLVGSRCVFSSNYLPDRLQHLSSFSLARAMPLMLNLPLPGHAPWK
jgi:hypothetical protein